jgi:hypothetical protein
MRVFRELLATTAAVETLGARAISIEEAQQLLDNRYVILRNPGRRRRRGEEKPPRRGLLRCVAWAIRPDRRH